MEFAVGLLMVLLGILLLIYGIKQDNTSMIGLKYRHIILGVGVILFGLIIMFR